MDTENQKDLVDQSPEASSTADTKSDSVAYESYQKALHQKKKAQTENAELQAELKALREEKLQREGKIEELNATYKTERDQFEAELKKTKQQYAWNSLTNSIKAEAEKHGCLDTDLLIKAIDDDDLNRINVGENFSIDNESLNSVIADTKKKKPMLFKASSVPVANGTPNTKVEKPAKKQMKDMSLDELREAYKNSYK